ncbi:unnamed protein product [Ectocarpus sp. 12 AP-2014]
MESEKKALLTALLQHPCLLQLRECASMLNTRYRTYSEHARGSSSAEWQTIPYVETVLEELILENFEADKPASWTRANQHLRVYRRNLKEFMDVLLKRGRFKDSDHTKDKDGVSEWAPRQFLCPITQGGDQLLAQAPHLAQVSFRAPQQSRAWKSCFETSILVRESLDCFRDLTYPQVSAAGSRRWV